MTTQQRHQPSDHNTSALPSDRRLAVVASWTLLVSVVAVLVLRTRVPSHPILVAIVGFAPFGILPAIAAVAGALWSGRRVLTVLAAATTVAYVGIVAPHGVIGGCTSTPADGSIRVLTANVEEGGSDAADIASLIADQAPDIILLQEAMPATLESLQDDGSLAAYEYRSDASEQGPVSVVVWSRWPMASVERERFSGVPLVHATISSPGGDIIVTSVHTTSPYRTRLVTSWLDQFQILADIDTATPRILAGDFNATADHRPFRVLLSQGWTDAYDERGCGLDATWPARGLPFAFYRLDHVLVTDHFEVDSLQVADLPGSDHKPLLVTVHLGQGTT